MAAMGLRPAGSFLEFMRWSLMMKSNILVQIDLAMVITDILFQVQELQKWLLPPIGQAATQECCCWHHNCALKEDI